MQIYKTILKTYQSLQTNKNFRFEIYSITHKEKIDLGLGSSYWSEVIEVLREIGVIQS